MTKKGKYVMTAVLGAAAGIAAEETTIGKLRKLTSTTEVR